jgi:hypothetical protein
MSKGYFEFLGHVDLSVAVSFGDPKRRRVGRVSDRSVQAPHCGKPERGRHANRPISVSMELRTPRTKKRLLRVSCNGDPIVKGEITIFHSWQSDSPSSTNRNFIADCLDRAIKKLKKDANLKIEPTLDRETQDVPGSPDIVDTIIAKIRNSHVFVGDVSIINPGGRGRPTPNPNVAIELGYALAYGERRAIKALLRP